MTARQRQRTTADNRRRPRTIGAAERNTSPRQRPDPSCFGTKESSTRQANEGFAKVVAARGSFQDPALDLADELAGLLGEWLAGDRVGVELEYEPYLTALRNPALRPVAAEW